MPGKRRHDDYDLVKKTKLSQRLECVELRGSKESLGRRRMLHTFTKETEQESM
jgi:hypothetical protein